VSVVVPTYDQDAWLPAAVASLLAQTVEDWECVVVDDGSPVTRPRASARR
jgi:glycosyltransferase involved in cell wall biosynthesis